VHISDEELKRYALKRLRPELAFAGDSHLAASTPYSGDMPELVDFMLRLQTLRKEPSGADREQRCEHRIVTDEPAQMRLLSPFSPDILTIRILNVSRGGLKVSVPIGLSPTALVQVRSKQAIILGEVRYCVSNGEGWHAGIKIYDVFSI